MMASSELTYAVRSIRRNVRRTFLSVLGVTIGVALLVVVESFNRGKNELFTRAAAQSGVGHLRVVPAGWNAKRDPRMRLADPEAALREARALPGVAVVAPRIRAQALLAMGTHVVAVELTGVDPAAELRSYRYARKVTDGRYLVPGDAGAIYVGKAIAERLDVEVGDELLATTVGRRGELESAMFRIVGVAATGSEGIDLTVCQAPLADVERLSGLPGLGEVTLTLTDWRGSEDARAALRARLGGGADEVLTWRELAAEIVGHAEQENQTTRVVTGIILLVVLIGVASAQLASVLERRREFAVLAALGMGGPRLVRVVLAEGVALGLAGALGGLAVGGPLAWLLATRGLDFSSVMSSYAVGGMAFDPIMYGDFGLWILPEALLVAIVATVLASLYPAWFAARTDPATALRVAQ